MIQGHHIERLASGLVIQHLYIDLIPILAGINPVDLAVRKPEFIGRRLEVPGRQLLGKRPHRTLQHALHAHDHIFIPCGTIQYRIAIVRDRLFHAFVNEGSPLLLF